MSPEMTKHYQAHADRKAKEKYLSQMPDFLGVSAAQQLALRDDTVKAMDLRKQLKARIDKMTMEQLETIDAFLNELTGSIILGGEA